MANITLGVDPGLRESGWALFQGKELLRAGLARSPERTERGPIAWRAMAYALEADVAKHTPLSNISTLVLEGQQVYRTAQQRGDQDDLLQLAGVNGAISVLFKHVTDVWLYLPRVWKGQVPQKIFAMRMSRSLTEVEEARVNVCPSSLRHNTLHALGLTRFHLGIKR